LPDTEPSAAERDADLESIVGKRLISLLTAADPGGDDALAIDRVRHSDIARRRSDRTRFADVITRATLNNPRRCRVPDGFEPEPCIGMDVLGVEIGNPGTGHEIATGQPPVADRAVDAQLGQEESAAARREPHIGEPARAELMTIGRGGIDPRVVEAIEVRQFAAPFITPGRSEASAQVAAAGIGEALVDAVIDAPDVDFTGRPLVDRLRARGIDQHNGHDTARQIRFDPPDKQSKTHEGWLKETESHNKISFDSYRYHI